VHATNLANLYGLPLLDWSDIQDRLDAGISQAPGCGGPNRHTCWLATINPDGSPHVTGVGSLWANGAARVDDTGHALTAEFSAHSAGPPPWFVYCLTAHAATALVTIPPGGATRWQF